MVICIVTTRPPKTIVKPTALGPVANTDTKLLIYGLFQKGRVLAQDGVYDLLANRGTVFIGTSYNTPDFAVNAIEKWWRTEGRRRYPAARDLAILADAGGSNGYRCRGWKHGLQTRICNRHDIAITIAHYPSGTSKWNPVEHRLFSEISKNWAGRPLDSYETILKYIRTTTTSSGLRVRAHLIRRRYPKGVKITDERMQALSVTKDQTLPKWNYTIRPS